jgi:predicted nucleic acid-binding protein
MSCFVDTNVLVYAADESNPEKRMRAREWLDDLAKHNRLVLSPQSISEFYHVSRRRFSSVAGREILQACERFLIWCTAELDARTIRKAWLIEEVTNFQWFDCLLLASAAISGCGFFLSEDLQHGRLVDDLKIVDPFKFLPSDVFTSTEHAQE